MKKVKINLFGSSNCGKSTLAAEIFTTLKKEDYSVELVTEYIKDWVYEKRIPQGYDDLYVFAKQLRKEELAFRNNDIIVTCSPIRLNVMYGAKRNGPYWEKLWEIANEFDKDKYCLNFWLDKRFPFKQEGRFEGEEKSKEREVFFKDFLEKKYPQYYLQSEIELSEHISIPNYVCQTLKHLKT